MKRIIRKCLIVFFIFSLGKFALSDEITKPQDFKVGEYTAHLNTNGIFSIDYRGYQIMEINQISFNTENWQLLYGGSTFNPTITAEKSTNGQLIIKIKDEQPGVVKSFEEVITLSLKNIEIELNFELEKDIPIISWNIKLPEIVYIGSNYEAILKNNIIKNGLLPLEKPKEVIMRYNNLTGIEKLLFNSKVGLVDINFYGGNWSLGDYRNVDWLKGYNLWTDERGLTKETKRNFKIKIGLNENALKKVLNSSSLISLFSAELIKGQILSIKNNIDKEIKPSITIIPQRVDRIDVLQEDISGDGFLLTDKKAQIFIPSQNRISQVDFYIKSGGDVSKLKNLLISITDLAEKRILGRSYKIRADEMNIPGWNSISIPIINLISGTAYKLIFSPVGEGENICLGTDKDNKNIAFRIKYPLPLSDNFCLLESGKEVFSIKNIGQMLYNSYLTLNPDGTGEYQYLEYNFKDGNWLLNSSDKTENVVIVDYNPDYIGPQLQWGDGNLIKEYKIFFPVKKVILHISTYTNNVGNKEEGKNSLIDVFISLDNGLTWKDTIYKHIYIDTPGIKKQDIDITHEIGSASSLLVKYYLSPKENWNNSFISLGNGITNYLDTKSTVSHWLNLKPGDNIFTCDILPDTKVKIIFSNPQTGEIFESITN